MIFKRIFSAVTAAAICLTISSCGKQLPEPEIASKEHVYREDRIELSEELNEINKIMYYDGLIYLLATKSTDNEDGSYSVKDIIDVMTTDGVLEKEFEIDVTSGTNTFYITNACIDGRCPIAAHSRIIFKKIRAVIQSIPLKLQFFRNHI